MDFVTHSLMGAGAARLIAPRREWRPQLSLAALGGSLVMDGDSWLYLLGPNYYGFYHRLASHNVIALILIALIAATGAWSVARVCRWRRFGWFVAPNLPRGVEPSRPPWGWFFLVAAAAAFLHFCADVITGYGNMCPFWPWSKWDASLSVVSSFDQVIFWTTIAWHLLIRHLDWPRRREWPISLVYLVMMAAYIGIRLMMGKHSII